MVLAAAWFASAAAAEETVNIYTARHYESDKELYAAFREATGITVNVVGGQAPELIERIRREGENTHADLFITVDGGILGTAKKAGALQPAKSETIDARVPADLRDPDYHWIGLTTRCRVIVYSKERVDPGDVSSYAALADPRWKGRVLVRSSSSLYDQSLLASFIVLKGGDEAYKWAAGVALNLARQPQGNDRDQAKAIVAGKGDVALMNTYYIGQMLYSKDPEEAKAARGVGVAFPDQDAGGAHANISGVGIVRHAKNRENALKFIEFMVGVEAQEKLSAGNYEFPVNPKAARHELLRSWGDFRIQKIDFNRLGDANPEAVEIFSRAGWK